MPNKNQSNNFEKYFFYRLVKVIYIIFFLGLTLLFIAIGWSKRPQKYVDNAKSYLLCRNGNNYNLKDTNIYLFSEDSELSGYNDEEAKKLCLNFDREKAKKAGYLDYEIDNYLSDKLPKDKNYSLSLNYSIKGDWLSSLLWWLIGIGGTYIILNLIRETLLYIFIGKKFSWEWLRTIWYLVDMWW